MSQKPKPAAVADEADLLGAHRPAGVPAASASQETALVDPAPNWLPPGHVPVVDDSGTLTSIPESEYADALSRGFRFQAPDEQERYAKELKYGTTGQQIKTGLEGVARGLTLGLSDAAEEGLGIADTSDIKGRQEINPITAGVGEMAGAVAPAFIPGVGELMLPSLASKAATAGARALVGAGETTLGRIGAKALAGALEGSLWGAGSTVSEAALGDPSLNAESIIAHVGLGSLMGASGGLLGGTLEEAAGPALRKLAGSMDDVEGLLHGISNEQSLKAAGGIQSSIQKMSRSEQREVATMLRERGHIGGDATETLESVQKDLGEVAKRVGGEMGIPEMASGDINPSMLGGKEGEGIKALKEALDAHGSEMGKILKDADAAGAQVNHTRVMSILRNAAIDQLDPIERDLAEPFLARILKGIETSASEGKGFEALNAIKSTLQRDINYVSDSGALLGVKKKLVGILTDEIDTQLAPQVGSDLAKRFLDAKKTYGLLATGIDALGKSGSRGTDAIGAMVARAGLDTAEAKTLGLLSKAEALGIKGANRAAGNRTFSLGDRIKGMTGAGIGAMIGGPFGAIVGQEVGQIAERFARTRGPAFAALAADWIAKTPALMAVAEHFGHSASKVVNQLGEFAPTMTTALASGPANALATHIMLAKESPAYREKAALAGLVSQTPEEEGAALERAYNLDATRLALKEQGRQTDRQIEHVLKGEKPPKLGAANNSQDFGAKRMRQESASGHERHVDDVMKLAADPSALVDRIAENLGQFGDHAPDTAAALSATAYRAVQFLASKAATPPKGGPLAQKWHPSPSDVAKFGRYLEAVQDPASVMRHAAAGTLAPEHVEALQTVYPAYYAHLQGRILDRLTANPKAVPYRARVMLALLSGVDPDGTLSPASIQRAQAVFAAPSPRDSSQQASPGIKPSTTGAAKLSVANRTQTRSQATEAREG